MKFCGKFTANIWATILYKEFDNCTLKITASSHKGQWVNSLAPGKFEWNFRHVFFKQILVTDGWGISCEIGITWMSLDFADDQSTLVQIMAWCRQATSHYLSQCWPRSLLPYGVTRPQWVNLTHCVWPSLCTAPLWDICVHLANRCPSPDLDVTQVTVLEE